MLLRQVVRSSCAAVVGTLLVVGSPTLVAQPASATPLTAPLSVGHLEVDNGAEPLGVGAAAPRFSWQLSSQVRAVLQTSYEVQVGTDAQELAEGHADVWDSGVQGADQVSDVRYAGPQLDSATRYYWRVASTTDRAGQAWSDVSQFTTGLLSPEDKSAQWVGQPTQSAQDWSDYTLESDFQVVAETATLYFRAHGTGNSYMWQLAIEGNKLAFKPHVRANGGFEVLDDIPISDVPSGEIHDVHHLKVAAVGSSITTWVDGTEIDERTLDRYATGGIGFRATASETARWSNMKVTSEPDGDVLFEDAFDANPFSAGSAGPDGLTVTNASPILQTPGSQSWGDYRVDVDVTLEKEAATLYLRSDGSGANSYMWQLNATGGDGLVFKPHRRVGGGYEVLDEVPIDADVVAPDAVHDPLHLTVELTGNHIVTSVNGHQIDARDVGNFATGTIGMRQSGTEQAVFSNLEVVDGTGQPLLDNSLQTRQAFGLGSYANGTLTVHDADVVLREEADQTPLLRREFDLDQSADHVARALLFSTAKGVYGAELNGSFVNEDRLSPGSSDYRKDIYYQTTDVADLLRSGDNAIAVQLAPGWYAGNIGWFGPNQFGVVPQFWGRLEVTFDDGTSQTISTGPDWKFGTGSLLSADLYDGEAVDLRNTPTGWDEPGFDDSGWADVRATDSDPEILRAQVGPTIRPTNEIEPVSREEVSPGVYVFDLGQEISGVVRMDVDGPAGQEVTLRHGQDVTSDGQLYTANLVAGSPTYFAQQTDTVIVDGNGPTTYEPRYTYHGFRYFEVTGYPGVPELSDFRGVSLGTDVDTIGGLATGDDMLDQLQSNVAWSVRNNLMSIPTDTNARAERLGWAGDATFSAPSASYNYDLDEFYRKWVRDLVTTQQPSGLVNNVAPSWPAVDGGGYGGGWGDAIIAIPYTSWQRYGDTSIVTDNYDAMRKWLLFLEQQSNGSYRLGGGMGPAGDWMNGGEGTDGAYTATGYFGWDAKVLAQMATALGKTEDAARFTQIHDSISRAMVDAGWIKDNGVVEPNTQTAYVMALYADLVPEGLREAAGDRLVANIEGRGVHLSTGFVGTGWLLPVLDELGRTDLAYGLVQQTTYPSWGYMIDNGATTIWERWDFKLPGSGDFNPNVGGSSDDHGVFGSVGNWMYDTIGGIAPDPEHPGYRQFLIAPQPGGTIDHGAGTFDSRYGAISTSWSTTGADGRFALDATVPTGSTAIVSIPVGADEEVREGGRHLSKAEGVSYLGTSDGVARLRVGSGHYDFAVTDASAPAPTGVLSTTAGSPTSARTFDVTATFDQDVTGLELADLVVQNGSAANLAGTSSTYTFTVTAVGDGPVTVRVPAGAVANVDGVDNVALDALTVTVTTDPGVLTSVTPPRVAGRAVVGSTLSASPGTWSADGVRLSQQWLRNGSPIAGATRTTYRITAADVGKRISVRVTAVKAGLQSGTATSAITAPVAKARSVTKLRVSKKQVRAGTRVRVSAAVTAAGTSATGKVRVLVDGKVVKTLALAHGRAAVKVVAKHGAQRITVRYLGSRSVAPSVSVRRVLRGR